MPSEAVSKLLQEAEKLSDEERLELVIGLLERIRDSFTKAEQHYWQEIRGIAPDLLSEDAQEWVKKERLKADQGWQKAWGVSNENR